ncbi:MAG TPA: hypothetical protein VGK34_10675 [Armatimonadota bacterium]|jgi:hypothetical protein
MHYRILRIGPSLGLFAIVLLAFSELACHGAAPPTGPKNVPTAASIAQPASIRISDGNRLGYSLLSKSNYSAAMVEFTKVLQIDTHNARAMIGVAYCFGGNGQWATALSQAEDAILYNPRNTFALLSYLDISSRLDRLKDGLAMVRTRFNTSNKSAAPVAWTLAQNIVEVDYWSAQWFAQKAHELDPVAYPSIEIHPRPLIVHITPLPPVEEITVSTPEEAATTAEAEQVPVEDVGGTQGYMPNIPARPAPAYGGRTTPFTSPFNNYGIGPMQVLPFEGGGIPYESYSIGNNLTYIPPYSGTLNW